MGASFLLVFAFTTWLARRNEDCPHSLNGCQNFPRGSIRTPTRKSTTTTESGRIGSPFLPWHRTERTTTTLLFSQLSQKQIAKDIRSRYLEPLLEQANLDINTVSVEKLSDLGFSNNVFKLVVHQHSNKGIHHNDNNNNVLVAKVFSDLAKKRVHPNQKFMGEIDKLLNRQGIGPNVVAHTSDALLMEYIDGEVLTESKIFHQDNGLSICNAVGDQLGRMHSLVEGNLGGPNMLWRALDVLLNSIDDKLQIRSETAGSGSSGTTWTLPKLQDTIGEYRNRLEALGVPQVQMGHGDFKLSNVMITNNENSNNNGEDIRFIDFELTGTHYRGYDLAKFFRSSKELQPSIISPPLRRKHQMEFWESYQKRIDFENGGADGGGEIMTAKGMAEAVSQLEWEAELLEPMTWLEAASFFLSMANLDDPSQKEKWNGMAIDRLTSFEKMKIDMMQ